MGQVLNAYQFWLDELFPKAKFADGLSIIETLGHKKTMQISRTVWIDEDKHIASPSDGQRDDDGSSPRHEPREAEYLGAPSRIRNEGSRDKRGGQIHGEGLETDEHLDEMMALEASHTHSQDAMAQKTLDAGCAARPADLFADDEEAMADLDW